MDTERPLNRRLRATALIAVAVIAIAVASVAYLNSTQTSKTHDAPGSSDPRLVTRQYVIYSFTSAGQAWALEFSSGTITTGGQITIFRTADRGKHWEKKLQFGANEFGGYWASPIQVLDSTHCFVWVRGSTDKLFRTGDGGEHWDSVTLPNPRVVDMAFSDPNYGWLVALTSTGSDLYATRDAGASWQRLPAPPPDWFHLTMRSPTEAWVSGYSFDKPHVFASRDTGQSWQRHDLPAPPGGSWGSGSRFPPSVQLLPRAGVVASVPSDVGPPTYLATSFDGGVTWRYVPPPPATVAYQDANHWWAIKGSLLYKSSDAGQTWTQVTSALPDWVFRPELHILDSKHAWVTVSVPTSLSSPGGNGLAFTDDGGLHWTRATVPHGG